LVGFCTQCRFLVIVLVILFYVCRLHLACSVHVLIPHVSTECSLLRHCCLLFCVRKAQRCYQKAFDLDIRNPDAGQSLVRVLMKHGEKVTVILVVRGVATFIKNSEIRISRGIPRWLGNSPGGSITSRGRLQGFVVSWGKICIFPAVISVINLSTLVRISITKLLS